MLKSQDLDTGSGYCLSVLQFAGPLTGHVSIHIPVSIIHRWLKSIAQGLSPVQHLDSCEG